LEVAPQAIENVEYAIENGAFRLWPPALGAGGLVRRQLRAKSVIAHPLIRWGRRAAPLGRRRGSRSARRGKSSATPKARPMQFRSQPTLPKRKERRRGLRSSGEAKRHAPCLKPMSRGCSTIIRRGSTRILPAVWAIAPALIADAPEAAAPGRRFAHALDFGCGTGLMGQAARGRVDHLTGVAYVEQTAAAVGLRPTRI
jgi:hypothetical protein